MPYKLTISVNSSMNGKAYQTCDSRAELATLPSMKNALTSVLRCNIEQENAVVLTVLGSIEDNPMLWLSEKFPEHDLYVLDVDGSGSSKLYSRLAELYATVHVINCKGCSNPSMELEYADDEDYDELEFSEDADWVDVDFPVEYLTVPYEAVTDGERAFLMVDYPAVLNAVAKDSGKDIILYSQSEFANYEVLRAAILNNVPVSVEINIVPCIVEDAEASNVFEEDKAVHRLRQPIGKVMFSKGVIQTGGGGLITMVYSKEDF